MSELTCIIDRITGDLLVEGLPPEEVQTLSADLLPPAHEVRCAQPVTVLPPPEATPEEQAENICVRVAGYYHNSLIEGPGRRSTVKLQGCVTRCRGCSTPDSWSIDAGKLVPVEILAEALLDPAYERDGITALGGEPLLQPQGLLALVRALRGRGCPHIVVYSGYTFERLQRMAEEQPAIRGVLDNVEVLIDGPVRHVGAC